MPDLLLYIFLLHSQTLLNTSYLCNDMMLNIACQNSILFSCLLHFCTLCQTLGFDTECSCYMPLATSSSTATTAWLPHLICCLHHTHQYTHTGVRHTGITMPLWSSHRGGTGAGKPTEGGLSASTYTGPKEALYSWSGQVAEQYYLDTCTGHLHRPGSTLAIEKHGQTYNVGQAMVWAAWAVPLGII